LDELPQSRIVHTTGGSKQCRLFFGRLIDVLASGNVACGRHSNDRLVGWLGTGSRDARAHSYLAALTACSAVQLLFTVLADDGNGTRLC
jgi:hypothetical protein